MQTLAIPVQRYKGSKGSLILKVSRGDPLVIQFIKNRMSKGYSVIILVVGGTRTGKTALALKLASMLDPKFDIEKDLFFEIDKFAIAISSQTNKIYVLDEAGIELDPYEHMAIHQRVYSHIVQTQAYKLFCLFLITPFASELGKRHSKYANVLMVVLNRGCYKAYSVHAWHGDFSQKPPRISELETIIGVPLPPTVIWKPYIEKGQAIFKESILDLQMQMLDLQRKKKVIARNTMPNVVTGSLV